MASLPTEKLLASYWIPDVGIGSPIEYVTVPLLDILNYQLKDGTPQTNVVFLGFAAFTGTPTNFTAPYLSIPEVLIEQMTVQPGQTQSNVQQLQSAGIKVILSVQGYTPPNQPSGMGWDGVSSADNEAFASWVKTEVIDAYGLDGIDIDNEWSGLAENTQSFMDTVGVLRGYLPDSLITKALWSDTSYFQQAVSATSPYNAGAYLSSLLDFGSSMSYGTPTAGQKAIIKGYHDIQADGLNVGMAWNQLCIGVQAGPPPPYGSWMTPIDETADLAMWAVEPESPTKTIPPILGMMLYTFPQDIQQWTHGPQNSPGYMYPNANDHEWQKAIVVGMWGAENWVVK